MASKYNTKVYWRQTLIGGNYGLLDTNFHSKSIARLMGKSVLSLDMSGSPFLRAYAHCRKAKFGITLLLINLHRSVAFNVIVRNDLNINLGEGDGHRSFIRGVKRTLSWIGRKASDGSQRREEYHLTAKDGNHLSRTMLLNGYPLQLTKDEDIPQLRHVLVAVNAPISIAPLSIAFVVFPNMEAQACVPAIQ